jgi:hypothetical protein
MSRSIRHARSASSILALAALLAACGGGGDSAVPAPPAAPGPSASAPPPAGPGGPAGTPEAPRTLTVTGTAAIGAPLPNATVTLRDSTGRTKTTTSDDAGRFTFTEVPPSAGPVQLSASAQVGQRQVVHYAILPSLEADRVANVTPLTTAIQALVSPTEVAADLDAAQLAATSVEAIRVATEQVRHVIAPLAGKLVDASWDPTATPFAADGRGADLLLDHVDVAVQEDGVTVSNKMAVPGIDAESTGAASVRIPKLDATATKALASRTGKSVTSGLGQVPADATDTEGFDDLITRFTACFAVPAAQRLTGATRTTATLHDACADLAVPDYLHNGVDFRVRWARALTSPTLDTTAGMVFMRPEIRLRGSALPERMSVNFNFRDRDGNGYTTPEIIERQPDGRWKLYGSRRKAAAFLESALVHRTDLTRPPVSPVWGTPYNNVNMSQIESGFRVVFDPRLTFGSDGSVEFPVTDLTSPSGYGSGRSFNTIRTEATAAGRTWVKCVVVAGPGRFDADGAKWMGFFPHGIVLKRPTGSTVQDYMAIDARLSRSQRLALDARQVGDVVPEAGNGSAGSGFCGDGSTPSSNSTYAVETESLKNQLNPLTGRIDPEIDGRDAAWNTGARYARLAPDAALRAVLGANPLVTFYVIDNTNVLRMKFGTRYLGDLPSVATVKGLITHRKLPRIDPETLARYLDWSRPDAALADDVTRVSASWSSDVNAFGADGIGFYSEVYRATPGRGVSGPLSIHPENQSRSASSLWVSDDDLAGTLDRMDGTNFYWWHGAFATEPPVDGVCPGNGSGAAMSSTTTLGVGRGERSFSDRSLGGGRLMGTAALGRACLGSASNAMVGREIWTRTYTDRNVRVYVYTASRTIR